MQHRTRPRGQASTARPGARWVWATALALMLVAAACGDEFTGGDSTGGAGGTGAATSQGGTPGQCLNPYPAPPGGECPAECVRCAANECEIRCEAGSPCTGQTRQCPAGFDCVVVCTGAGPCAGATIACPPNEVCQVTCAGAGACTDLSVQCGNGPCTLGCDGSASTDVCTNATVDCGVERCAIECNDDTVDPPPTLLNCTASCECVNNC